MKYIKALLLFLSTISLQAQTENLINYEVTLIGPSNVDHHHLAQVNYYLDYFAYLEEEVDAWLKELNGELKLIRKRNRKRIDNKRPIKSKDYPAWKKNTDIIKDLEQDKYYIKTYITLWENYNYVAPDSVTKIFMTIFDKSLCFDLISEKLVLSPKEYKIVTYEPVPNIFIWKEFIPKTSFQCPVGYETNGKTCWKELSVDIENTMPPVFLIQNKLTQLPFHLDGFKQITCR
ncbi:MAG: hypothetical protein AB8G86_11085 [Saprospiraceae bacterium]